MLPYGLFLKYHIPKAVGGVVLGGYVGGPAASCGAGDILVVPAAVEVGCQFFAIQIR